MSGGDYYAQRRSDGVTTGPHRTRLKAIAAARQEWPDAEFVSFYYRGTQAHDAEVHSAEKVY